MKGDRQKAKAEPKRAPSPDVARDRPSTAVDGRPAATRESRSSMGDAGGAAGRARANRGLQRQAGNARLSRPTAGVVQAKLAVNQPGDASEQEADRVAAQVMRAPATPTGKPMNGRPASKKVQRREAGPGAPTVTPGVESYLQSGRGSGRPLPDETRAAAEQTLNSDMSGVRVHDDAAANEAAASLNARAFTHGSDIYLARGESANDRQLMGHEMAHVVQQRGDEGQQVQRQPAAPPGGDRQESAPAPGMPRPAEGLERAMLHSAPLSTNGLPDSEPQSLNEANLSPGMPDTSLQGTMALPPPGPTPGSVMASAGRSFAPPAPQTGQLVQRQEEGGLGGFVRGIGETISSGIRAGVEAVGGLAAEILDSVRSRVNDLIGEAQSLLAAAGAEAQNLWSTLSETASRLVDGVKRMLGGAISSVAGIAMALAQAVINLDANALASAWDRITSLISAVWQRLQQAGQAVLQRIAILWAGLQQRLSGALERVTQLIQSAFSALASAGQRLLSLLPERVQSVLQPLRDGLSSLWETLQRQAAVLWNQLVGLWNALQQWATEQVQSLVQGVMWLWNAIRGLAIGELIRKISFLAQIIRMTQDLYDNLTAYLEPIARDITDRAYAGMPGSALEYANEQFGKVGAGAGQERTPVIGETPGSASAGAATGIIQRQAAVERRTATWEEITAGVEFALIFLWESLSWSNFFKMVLDILLEQLFPPLAIFRQLKAFFLEDMAHMINGLYWPRNIFEDPWGALHDIYTILFHIVVDTLMSLARRLVNILMSYMLWITIVLTALGAVGGAAVVGILGGILGFLALFGIGAGPGAAVGAGAGGAAGAGVGFGVSVLLNEAIFFAFLIVQGTTIVQLLLDLLTTRQTDEEKRLDYRQGAESLVAVGVGLALLVIAWIAGWVARGVAALVRKLPRLPAVPPGPSRFFRGIGSVRPRRGVDPSEAGRALAVEQRLAGEIGGELARTLVSQLGPDAAEHVVARLTAARVQRLGQELAPEVLLRIANAGVRPTQIDAAIAANQVQRLGGLSAEQLQRFSTLSDDGFARIIALPDAQFERFASLGEVQLRAFAEMDAAAFNRFAALDDATFGRFRDMAPDKLEAFGRLSDSAFNRYMALSPADFAKFESLSPEAIARFGGLSDAAFARFSAMSQTELVKFANVTEASMERLAALPPGELENMAATMSELEIHRQVLGRDPAIGGRLRPAEADTALRLEQARNIVLDRYMPASPREKGDWFDIATNEVYDGCSPPETQYFDPQIQNGNYEAALRDHLASPTVDYVVIDITGLNLTPAQQQVLDALITAVAGPNNPSIVRLP